MKSLLPTIVFLVAPSLALAQEAPVATTPPTPATTLTSPAEPPPTTASQTAATTPRPTPRRGDGLPAWPVRVHLSLPLGSTLGNDHLQGFTWGFRAALQVYPTPGFRWVGIGAFAEMLLDAETRDCTAFGGVVSGPLASWSWGDLRAGGTAGARFRGDADPRGAALALGAQIDVVFPAYLYDLSLGLRADATIDGDGVRAVSLLVDVDLAVLVAAVAGVGAGLGVR